MPSGLDAEQLASKGLRKPEDSVDEEFGSCRPARASIARGVRAQDIDAQDCGKIAPAAHARLPALRGAETNFRVRNCRRFHLKALDHLVLLNVFLLRRLSSQQFNHGGNWDEQQGP
jgi:hypothetical protein